MIFRVVSDVDWSYSRPEKMTFKIKPQSKNDFLYVPSVETSLLIHMSFHTDGHKIIRSRYWWNFSISTQSRFFPKHPVSKKRQVLLHCECLCIRFFSPSLFINRENHETSAGKGKPGSARLALKGEISSGWDSNPANLSKLQRFLWHSNYTGWFIGISRMAYYIIYMFG